MCLEKFDGQERNFCKLINGMRPGFQQITKFPVDFVLLILIMKYFKGCGVKILFGADRKYLTAQGFMIFHMNKNTK